MKPYPNKENIRKLVDQLRTTKTEQTFAQLRSHTGKCCAVGIGVFEVMQLTNFNTTENDAYDAFRNFGIDTKPIWQLNEHRNYRSSKLPTD